MTNSPSTKPPARVEVTWAGERRFDAGRPGGPTARIDGNAETGQTPVDALVSALAACTMVDVVDILAKRRTPLSMIVPAGFLAIAALVVGLLPRLGAATEAAAVRFQDEAGYNATVLSGARVAHPVALYPVQAAGVTLAGVLVAAGSVLGSLVLGALALYWRRLSWLPRFAVGSALARPVRALQSGVVTDYVTWIVLGLACIGGALAAAIR